MFKRAKIIHIRSTLQNYIVHLQPDHDRMRHARSSQCRMQQARRYRADARAGFWGWMSRRKIREKRKDTPPGRSSRPTWLARVEISRETKFSPPGESLEATRCRGNYRTNWNSDKKASSFKKRLQCKTFQEFVSDRACHASRSRSPFQTSTAPCHIRPPPRRTCDR